MISKRALEEFMMLRDPAEGICFRSTSARDLVTLNCNIDLNFLAIYE